MAEGRNKNGQFAPGNQLQKLAHEAGAKLGRPRKYNPQELLQGIKEYFDLILNNPIFENILHQKTGEVVKIPRQKPLTIIGLCNHIGLTIAQLKEYETNEKLQNHAEFKNIITHARQICYQQKFEGAAVGIFNSNIIARDLGLIDKTETNEGPKKIKIEVIPYNEKTADKLTPGPDQETNPS